MVTYHKLDITLIPGSAVPHPFIGSTLRGAFGVSLKKVVCINPSFSCEGCFAKDNCIYYDFYEQKNKAHKYRFDFKLNPKNYDFSLYLFDDATDKLPYVVSAIHKMLTEQGLGVNRDKYTIQNITCNDKTIYKDGKFDLSDSTPQHFKPKDRSNKIALHYITPLRTKYKGRFLSSTPPLETLIYSIHNRLCELTNMPKTRLTFTPSYKELKTSVRFTDQTRRSNRQKTKLQIGGITGDTIYEDIDEKSLMYLQLGELIGVGKQTVFGMGKIYIEDLEKECETTECVVNS